MKTLRVPRGKSFRSSLLALRACNEACAWVGRRSLRTAWRLCERGDWMLWLAATAGVDRRLLVRAACDCARLALPRVPAGENRSRVAIETAERWCDGLATLDEVRAAAAAAYAAAAYAASSAAAAERPATGRQCAGLVRARIPYAVIATAMESSHG